MLTIRKEQLEVLEACMLARFCDRLRRHLRCELAEETRHRSDEELLPIIQAGIQRGRQYGIATERDLTLFVDLLFLHSPHFEEAPDMAWAKKILVNCELAGENKMSLIYQRLAAQQQMEQPTGNA